MSIQSSSPSARGYQPPAYDFEMLTMRRGDKDVPVGGVECCHCGARGAIDELDHAVGCPNRE